ncbi:hypothetical protein WN51_05227 [Melipona quadrifasciata]|uniref:Uncharacterized protein n=1 Tax=Melipona quadrifasciata TaxID=166423 RepID=A0A0M8ZSW1_9HYME|nr:hypothetical protein WN51_05227 [Melipona quadrifasciata]
MPRKVVTNRTRDPPAIHLSLSAMITELCEGRRFAVRQTVPAIYQRSADPKEEKTPFPLFKKRNLFSLLTVDVTKLKTSRNSLLTALLNVEPLIERRYHGDQVTRFSESCHVAVDPPEGRNSSLNYCPSCEEIGRERAKLSEKGDEDLVFFLSLMTVYVQQIKKELANHNMEIRCFFKFGKFGCYMSDEHIVKRAENVSGACSLPLSNQVEIQALIALNPNTVATRRKSLKLLKSQPSPKYNTITIPRKVQKLHRSKSQPAISLVKTWQSTWLVLNKMMISLSAIDRKKLLRRMTVRWTLNGEVTIIFIKASRRWKDPIGVKGEISYRTMIDEETKRRQKPEAAQIDGPFRFQLLLNRCKILTPLSVFESGDLALIAFGKLRRAWKKRLKLQGVGACLKKLGGEVEITVHESTNRATRGAIPPRHGCVADGTAKTDAAPRAREHPLRGPLSAVSRNVTEKCTTAIEMKPFLGGFIVTRNTSKIGKIFLLPSLPILREGDKKMRLFSA